MWRKIGTKERMTRLVARFSWCASVAGFSFGIRESISKGTDMGIRLLGGFNKCQVDVIRHLSEPPLASQSGTSQRPIQQSEQLLSSSSHEYKCIYIAIHDD